MSKNYLNILKYICIVLPLSSLFIFINYFSKIIPFIKLNNISLFTPLYISIAGTIFCIITLILNKSKLTKIALTLNIIIISLYICFLLFALKMYH
ncbi:hypothetical protein GCM10008906_12120 [Clostridium oceanicum]|uniref:Uncharacterized protein n=1 Tax=Clostridium oceanicum TaxID=1543 RepID=A0ABP3UMF2_9CLOT